MDLASRVTVEAATFPSQGEALELHGSLLRDDAVAPSDVAVAYLGPLSRWLRRQQRTADESQCDTAAEDAILAFIKRPESYDPARAPLDAYLRMAAKRDLQNAQRAEYRHGSRQAEWGAVELSPVMRNHLVDDTSDPATIFELREMLNEIVRKRPRLTPDAIAGLTPGEVQALALVECGERRTELFAVALGIGHLPVGEQRAQVKRVKDRLKARLRRAGPPDE